MSKRDLKKYLAELDKGQLEEQFIEMYDKFSQVKVYYDFVFNPKEEKLADEAKAKIANEYFPAKGKRPKLRRSTAQKYIKHFQVLGVDSFIIADVMLYNMETAQRYSLKKLNNPELFYKSILNSFSQAIAYFIEKGILYEFVDRVKMVKDSTVAQKWNNKQEFVSIVEQFDY